MTARHVVYGCCCALVAAQGFALPHRVKASVAGVPNKHRAFGRLVCQE